MGCSIAMNLNSENIIISIKSFIILNVSFSVSFSEHKPLQQEYQEPTEPTQLFTLFPFLDLLKVLLTFYT